MPSKRSKRWEIKTRTELLSPVLDASHDLNARLIKEAYDEIDNVYSFVAKILDQNGVLANFRIIYRAYAEELWKLKKTYSSSALQTKVDALYLHYLTTGLNNNLLIQIAEALGLEVSYPENIVDKILPIDGLVLYLPFDEGTGTIAHDMSPYGNNGTLVNGPTWVRGKLRKALSFDGVDDYVAYPDIDMLSWTELTFEAWVMPSSLPSRTRLIVAHGAKGLAELQMVSGAARFAVCDTTATWYYSPTYALTANKWVHLVGTWKRNGTIALYVNGTLVGTPTSVPDLGLYDYTNVGATIGAWRHGVSAFFPGIIDEVRIYNRALSPKEIEALYLYAL